ncbi:hypothetical protein VE04_09766 [Pseudogymnoascus sp. 24MN13]|nr:hypothetical protein VE04_09766 [Pseudogymnoascus sp. 24MN13]
MLTPSLARVLSPTDFPSLKLMVTGGEPLLQSDIQRWTGLVKLINSYGPAECSVYSHAHPVTNTSDQENIHIGRGVACVGWIVSPNDHHKLLPIGAVGELLIDGYIIGRGYLNDLKGTAKAFIDAPSWLSQFHDGHGHRRFYKTGDLVQYTSDGSLRCIGRKDNQIKLRGQRIGLGEVEHNLRECFVGTRDVVAELVVADDNVDRPPISVAFVQLDEDKDEKSAGKQTIRSNAGATPADEAHIIANSQTLVAPTEDFRSRVLEAEFKLHNVVPNYMVPSVFIQVVQVPLTTNGKTDRRYLQELVASLSKEELQVYSGSGRDKRMPSPDMEIETKL